MASLSPARLEMGSVRLKASAGIMDIYNANRQKLTAELAKPNKDKACQNAIEAYRHIVTQMEKVYNLGQSS